MRLQFSMSEAQADRHPDWETRQLTVDTATSVELVYDTLRDSSTSTVLAAFDPAQGGWIAERDGRLYSDVVIAEPTLTERQVDELLTIAERLEIPEDALDRHVHDLVSRPDSSINTDGRRGQLEFLLGHLGFAEVRRILSGRSAKRSTPQASRWTP